MATLDREKVIKGLECCMSDGSECYEPSNGKCPYYKDDVTASTCTDDLFYDIYALLKAQEPRVIPINDLLKHQDYAWIEFRRTSRLGVRDRDDIQFLMTQPETASRYNITWRCWTFRPTKELRKATSWLQ